MSGLSFKKTLWALAVAGCLFSGACAEKTDYSRMSAERMFGEARSMSEKGKNFSRDRALEMLKELQLRHPFSPYAPLASLKTADIYFDQKKYKSAADQYARFISDNTKHEEREYALWRLSRSFFNLRESSKRDQAPCKKTVYWSQALLSYHPESEYKQKAAKQIETCSELLAESEIEIAKFYLKRKNFEAARRRLASVADNFSGTRAMEKSAKMLAELPPRPEEDNR